MTKAPKNVVASVLARLRDVAHEAGPALSQAIRSTFDRRQTCLPVIPPAALTAKFHSEPVHVRQWAAFVRRIGEPALANEFSRVVADLTEFLMPAAKAAATSVQYCSLGAAGSVAARTIVKDLEMTISNRIPVLTPQVCSAFIRSRQSKPA